MKTRKALLMSAVLSLFLVAGCEQQGPAERAGEAIDDAADEIRDRADDVGNELEDACEEATQEDC